VYVTFDDARAFCAWNKSALPTVEQWVRACRGNDRRIYPWGDAFDPAKCNTNESCPGERTTSVWRFESGKSPFGCYDLVGNVEEWTAGSEGGYFAVLGGSYADSCAVQGLPIANLYSDPSQLSSDRGFRCVRPPASSR
jgi:formylglycine-generating enzyme required for sulfatase activity